MRIVSIPGLLAVGLTAALGSAGALAQDKPQKRPEIWDVHVGMTIPQIPTGFQDIACGTNGGPPSRPLPDFSGFMQCKPDDRGLHEVYFRYDDELEYWARAMEDDQELLLYGGTLVYDYPSVVSLLFDDGGVVRGERIVTDPAHEAQRRRIEFWTLGNFLKQRFGDPGWTCTDLPAAEGESPSGSYFIKNHCEKADGDLAYILEQRFFQKKGQLYRDPHTNKVQRDAFESSARFEIYDAAYLASHPVTEAAPAAQPAASP